MNIKTELTELAIRFMESGEMAQHMKETQWLDPKGIVFVIMTSRASLMDKLEAMRDFCLKLKQIDGEIEGWSQENIQENITECEKIIKTGEHALNETTENVPAGTVFLFKNACRHWIQHKLFTTFESAKAEILLDDNGRKDNYVIEKWIPSPTPNGRMGEYVSWELNHEGVIRTASVLKATKSREDGRKEVTDITYDLPSMRYIQVPFQVGDIVVIDKRPIKYYERKKTHAVISEIHDEWCYDGNINLVIIPENKGGAIESYLADEMRPCRKYGFSKLHRLTKFTGILTDEESPLNIISEDMKKNPSFGTPDNIKQYLTKFNTTQKNFLPHDVTVGDILYLKNPTSRNHSDTSVVVANIDLATDDVDVICEDGIGLRMVKLKELTGEVIHFTFKKSLHHANDSLIPQVSKELKNNPENPERLLSLNRLPYIPEVHKKYNLLPKLHKTGGDITFFPAIPWDKYEELEDLICSDMDWDYPYNFTISEMLNVFDGWIAEHGTEDGKLNKAGELFTAWRANVRDWNNKENWSVVRYIGESTPSRDNGFELTHGRYYYVPNKTWERDESDSKDGTFDVLTDAEQNNTFCIISKKTCTNWEIAEDPTGIIAKIITPKD
jgi:hypothetical protein